MGIRDAESGFTLVEMMVVLVVLGLLTLMAVPAWGEAVQRRRLAGISAELLTDLQYLRSAAVARNANLRIRFQQTAGGSCYVLHTGSTNSCTCSSSGTSCTASAEALKTVFHPASDGVILTSNSSSLLYSARLGTVTPTATLRLTGSFGITISHIVNLMGRVRTCTEDSAALGHPAC